MSVAAATSAQANSRSARARGAARAHGLRGAVARVPLAAWVCALVALANAATFSLIVPPFQVPDEPEHYAYTEYIAQTGRLPHAPPPATEFSPEEQAALDGLYTPTLLGGAGFGRPVWSAAEAAHAKALLAASPSRRGQGGVTGESDNPPLYYALEVVPYEVAGGSLIDRLTAMRLFSALLDALTVMFVFFFVREALPRPRWGATVGALLVALQPQVAFIAGGVNNDNLMFTASAALLWLLARAFRRGLSPGLGAGIGLAVAVGLLTKLTFIGLLPGVLVGLVALTFRLPGDRDRRSALTGAGLAVLLAALPVIAYLVLNKAVWERSVFQGALGTGVVSGVPAGAPAGGNFRELLSYIWQFYLPRLPGMHAQFSSYPLWHVWFQGFIGRFGLLDYGFPVWVYYLALALFLGILGLATRAMVAGRDRVRARWREIFTYAALLAGLLLAIARAGFPYHLQTHFVFEQARYLFPLLGLYGLLIALALRGAGRRWAATLAGTLIVAAIAHDLFAQLLTLQRYYT
jgi:4-amino-4-deoxy-L-arabinose transferase-like glycosyltransferase